MSEQVVNIGQIAAIWIASTPPENVKLIWYDTASQVHCVYDSYIGDWKPLDPQIITTTSINTLRSEAEQSGLPIGKFYELEDTGTLAISITTTKIWYVDIHGNYVVDDLASSAQYYLNSTNLYIDGETGVWDVDSGDLNFSFTEQNTASNLDTDKDYVVMRHNAGNGVWSWIKSKISTFISSVGGNSVIWNNGIYFNFLSAFNAKVDVPGGVVSKSTYDNNNILLDNRFDGITGQIDSAEASAKAYTDAKVVNTEIYDKELPNALTVPSAPPTTPSVSTKLITIIEQIYGWIAKLKFGSNINVGHGFNVDGTSGEVNQSDTITNAFQKIVYKLKHIWDYGFRDDDWTGMVSVGQEIGLFQQGQPTYTATLEGAVYLLSKYYKERMDLRVAAANYQAYYRTISSVTDDSVIINVEASEFSIQFTMSDRLKFTSIVADSDRLDSNQTNDDACLIIKNLSNKLIQRILDTYGMNRPIPTGIPITANFQSGDLAYGNFFAVLVQSVDSGVIAYLKLFPYFAQAADIDSQQQIVSIHNNSNCTFGSYWVNNNISEQYIISIPKFSFALPC